MRVCMCVYVYVRVCRTGAAAAAGAVGQEELRLPPRCRGGGTLRGVQAAAAGSPAGRAWLATTGGAPRLTPPAPPVTPQRGAGGDSPRPRS